MNIEYWHVSTGNPGCLFWMCCLGFGGAYPMNLDDGTSMWGCSKGWDFGTRTPLFFPRSSSYTI